MVDLLSDERIAVVEGQPAVQGTRVLVAQVLERLAEGKTPEEIRAEWPELGAGGVKTALEFAARAVRHSLQMPPRGEAPLDRSAGRSAPELDLNKILVVDDIEDGRILAQRILSNKGFTVSTAASGQEALEKARAELPFLVISDIMMPGMDGFELCQRLKADERTRDAAVIFVTAYPGDSDRVSHGLDLGATDYIARPFQNRELVARVQAVARLKRAELEARQKAQTIARRNEELEFLNHLAMAASSLPNLREVVVSLMPRLCRLLESEAVALVVEGTQGVNVCVAACDGRSADVTLDSLCAEEATLQGLQEQISRLLADPQVGFDLTLEALEFYSAPMISPNANGHPVGAIVAVCRREAPLTAADRMLLDSVAGIVAVAVENARLFNEVREFSRRLERMVEERTQQLVEEQKKTAAILASMSDGLLVLDAEDRIMAANRAAETMLAFRLDELRGRPIEGERSRSPLWTSVYEMVAGEEMTPSASVDLPDPNRPGAVLSIESRAARMQDEDGQPLGTVIVLRDITALKEVEYMKVRFMAGVTHELRTPLSVIRVHADNLVAYYKRLPNRKKLEMLETIRKQLALLDRLVEDILEMTRLDMGAIEMNRRPIDVGALTDEVVGGMRPLAEAKRIALRWQKPPVALMALADDKLVARAVRNLVDNAIKYTPNGGTVEVQALSMTVRGRLGVALQIKDTGIGIPPEYQERIFERFYRVDNSHTIPGTGLGLAIVKEIVEAHGGGLRLESAPGKGSTFTILLPGA